MKVIEFKVNNKEDFMIQPGEASTDEFVRQEVLPQVQEMVTSELEGLVEGKIVIEVKAK